VRIRHRTDGSERALGIARGIDDRVLERYCIHCLANASNTLGDYMRPLVAHCHFGFGALYRSRGKDEQARQHLTIATALYREMDMRFYLGQAEAM
jgi:hypothetical protein